MSAEELVRKKRVRAGHKASATRTVNRVRELLASIETGDRDSVTRLPQLKLSLQEKLDVLRQLDGDILDRVGDEDLASEIEQSDIYREGIYAAIVDIDRLCAGTNLPPHPPAPGPVLVAVDPVAPPRGNRVRLPRVTIRPFNGDITTWTTFWDSYDAAIHQNSDLSDIDKFNYLKSLLERTALEAVSGLTLTSANYEEAVLILKKRFGNKQQIIAKHMDTLLNVDAVTSQHNLKGLRHLYDLVESHVCGLQSLGVSSDSYGNLLSSVLVSKLPQDLQLIVSRKIGDEDWNLEALMEVVEQEVKARERTRTEPPSVVKKPFREQPTAATLLSGSSNSGPTCSYCQQAHSSHLCKTVTQVEARKTILKRSGRCFLCLKRGHISRDCRANVLQM